MCLSVLVLHVAPREDDHQHSYLFLAALPLVRSVNVQRLNLCTLVAGCVVLRKALATLANLRTTCRHY